MCKETLYYLGKFSINLTLFHRKKVIFLNIYLQDQILTAYPSFCLIMAHIHSMEQWDGMSQVWNADLGPFFMRFQRCQILKVKISLILEGHTSDRSLEHQHVCVSIPKKINEVSKKKRKGNYLWHVYNLKHHKTGSK